MASAPPEPARSEPLSFGSAAEMFAMGDASGQSIAAMCQRDCRGAAELDTRIMDIWRVMDRTIGR